MWRKESANLMPARAFLTIRSSKIFYRNKRNHVEIISIHNCKQVLTSLRAL